MAAATLSGPLRHSNFRDSAREVGNDERLAHSVASAVRAAGIRTGPGVTVLASSGQVTLRGLTRSFYEKQLVLHAAQHVDGVREIVDELDVVSVE